jgi:hypothetical protein
MSQPTSQASALPLHRHRCAAAAIVSTGAKLFVPTVLVRRARRSRPRPTVRVPFCAICMRVSAHALLCAALHCAQFMYSVQCASVWSELLLLYKPCCTECPIPLRVRELPAAAIVIAVFHLSHLAGSPPCAPLGGPRALAPPLAARACRQRSRRSPCRADAERTPFNQQAKLQLYCCADTVSRPPPSFSPAPSSSFRPCDCARPRGGP